MLTKKQKRNNWILTVVLLIVSLLFLFPVIWMLANSFKPDAAITADMNSMAAFIPPALNGNFFENYVSVLTNTGFVRYMCNTLFYAAILIVLGVIVNGLAGYALAKINFPFRERWLLIIMLLMIVPMETIITIHFLIIAKLGLLNTVLGYVLPMIVNPFNIFLFRQVFLGLPDDVYEAAQLDHCGPVKYFFTMVLPMSKSVVATVSVFTFLNVWNDYLWPSLVFTSSDLLTAQIGLNAITSNDNTTTGQTLAVITMVTIPVIIIYSLFSKQIVEGVISTGTKEGYKMSFIEFKNICKKYAGNDKNSVTDFNLDIEEKEYIAFVGPSGCGKSTTLRMIAGFEEITSGDLFIDGKRVNEVAPADRGISMVFQNYALYPHMTVEKNISYGLKNMKVPADEIKKKVDWAIDILGLEEYRYRKPKNLSGGQRQRVALGRAIVKDQKVFLMDGPLSNLDAKLRVSMRNEISKLHRNLGSTTIYVTHDQVEAMTMADRIVIMKDGVIQQVGKPMDLYEHPVNKFVAGFIGSPQMNFYDVKVDGKKLIFADGNTVELPEAIAKRIAGYSEVIMGIRGEDIKFDITNLDVYGSHQKAVIDNTEIMGNENNLYFDFGGSVTIARVSKYEVSQVGDEVEFTFMPHKMHFFDKETEQVIGAE